MRAKLEPTQWRVTRRRLLQLTGASTCASALAPFALIVPAHAATDWFALAGTHSVPPAESMEATMQRLFGGRAVEYSDAKVKLTVPNVAENGAVVPTEVELLASLAAPVFVQRIVWIVDRNKRPQSILYEFTEITGTGYAAAYLRMGESSRVRGILELSDGKLLGAWKEVAVVTGGCGG